MNKEEFVKLAEQAGYTDAEIKSLLSFHDETGVPFSEMPLMERRYN